MARRSDVSGINVRIDKNRIYSKSFAADRLSVTAQIPECAAQSSCGQRLIHKYDY
jgi:hypothetical protein